MHAFFNSYVYMYTLHACMHGDYKYMHLTVQLAHIWLQLLIKHFNICISQGTD